MYPNYENRSERRTNTVCLSWLGFIKPRKQSIFNSLANHSRYRGTSRGQFSFTPRRNSPPGGEGQDQARSRAYRWGEDGLAGICDDKQILCFALALWNSKDPILKERVFGLTNSEGNHGEDCKEYYFYLDSTPTHSYMKYPYTSIRSAPIPMTPMLCVATAALESVLGSCRDPSATCLGVAIGLAGDWQ